MRGAEGRSTPSSIAFGMVAFDAATGKVGMQAKAKVPPVKVATTGEASIVDRASPGFG